MKPRYIFSALYISILSVVAVGCHDNGKVTLEKEGAGVWSLTAGKQEKVTLLSELDIHPMWDAIEELGDDRLPISTDEISVEIVDGRTYVRFPLEKDERIFGLGLNFKSVEQQGRVMRLHVDHYGGADNGRTHAPVPFFVSSKGYGALINSARYIDAYIGTGVRVDSKNPPVARDRNTDKEWSAKPFSDNIEFLIPAEGVEIMLFSGDNMLEVVRRYNLYNGGGCLPPKWGLGFWQRVPSLYTDEQVKKEISDFRENKFPLNVIGLEPGWMSRSYPCTYEWDKTRFPDPKGFMASLDSAGVKANLWINPYVSPDGVLYDKVKEKSGSHTVWCGLVPDYTLDEVRDTMTAHFIRNEIDLGVSGFKIDENDGYDSWLWPDVARFPSGTSAEQMRQIYGALMQKTFYDMYLGKNERTYGLVRASNAGTSSFPFVIYNDYYDHRDFITALVNSSFIGVLWTPEVRSSRSAEEWIRRMQTVCFSPVAMLNAWSDGTKPWSFPEVAESVNEIAWLRMRLIPYLYSAFADYAFKGIPPVRAMNLVEGFDRSSDMEKVAFDATDNPYDLAVRKEIRDQFMVGESLLVAPLFAGEVEREVTLPRGKWYDFYTGEYVGEGEVIKATPGLDRIPVYVRDGGLIPMYEGYPDLNGSREKVEVRHYGEKPGSFSLYDDDGTTFAYKNGDYLNIPLSVTIGADGRKIGKVDRPSSGKEWSYGDISFRFMTKE
ncbi:MAG: glycoside hydrolase family 31 protein [Bacteroides sp.]|nr:glycoside hydrolase family 31 protein [Bacteroides sp.]